MYAGNAIELWLQYRVSKSHNLTCNGRGKCLYDRTIMHQGENDDLTSSESTVGKGFLVDSET